MKHVVFATYELHPVNPGGAGVLIAGAVRALAWVGYRVTVLCHFPESEVEEAERLLSGEDLAPGSVKTVSVARLLGKRRTDKQLSIYERKSAEFALALEALHRTDPVDLIEFPEYAGLAFATLRHRMEGSALVDVPVAIRLHGGLEFIDEAEGVSSPDHPRLQMYRLERLALQMADYVLAPSHGIAQFYRAAYGLSDSRILISPPPVQNLNWSLRRADRFPDPGHFLFYGKLQEVKGCDLLIEAAVSILAEHPERTWRFTFVGSDTPCWAHGRPTSQCLRPLIPRGWKHSFEFIPSIDRTSLPEFCRRVVAGVVPSRFETFCLAAHELRAVGLPLIVSAIPAFRDYFSEYTGCLSFDGSAVGLKSAMLRMSQEPGLAETLAARPLPNYPALVTAYQQLLENPASTLPRSPIEKRLFLHAIGAFIRQSPLAQKHREAKTPFGILL